MCLLACFDRQGPDLVSDPAATQAEGCVSLTFNDIFPAQTLMRTCTCKKTHKKTHLTILESHAHIHNPAHILYIARTHTHMLKTENVGPSHELPLGCAPVQCEVLMCLDSHISTLGETRKCTHTHAQLYRQSSGFNFTLLQSKLNCQTR